MVFDYHISATGILIHEHINKILPFIIYVPLSPVMALISIVSVSFRIKVSLYPPPLYAEPKYAYIFEYDNEITGIARFLRMCKELL